MSKAAQDRSDNLVWIRNSSSSTLVASTAGNLIDFHGDLETALGETPRNFTVERIIGSLSLTVPASTAPGRSYHAYLAIDMLDIEQVVAGAYPEPFADQGYSHPWVDGRRVFADHTVPASYPVQGINGLIDLDMKSKRKAKGTRKDLRLFGYHDNGLGVNPVLYWAYSALYRLR